MTITFYGNLELPTKASGTFNSEKNEIKIYLANIFGKEELLDEYYYYEVNDSEIWIRPYDGWDLVKSRAVKATFIHEFQHYLDNTRKILKIQTLKKINDKNIDDRNYFNLPYEKNAFTIETIYRLISKLIRDKDYSEIEKGLTQKEQSILLNFMRNGWRNDELFMEIYDHLEPKAQKRFLSRLYQYFSTNSKK